MTARRIRRLGAQVVVVSIGLLANPLFGADPAAADPISDKKAQAVRIAQQLQAQGTRVEQLSEAFNQARLQADALRTGIAATEAQLAQTEARAKRVRAEVRAQAVALFVTGGRGPTLEAISRGRPSDIVISQAYISTAFAKKQDSLDQMRSVNGQLHDQQAQLATEQRQAAGALARASAAKRAAATAQAVELATLGKVRGELAALVSAEQQRQTAAAAARIQAELAARLASSAAARSLPILAAPGGSGGGATGPVPAPNANAGAAVAAAQAELGKPYLWGGAGPNSFDCSGLTMWAWRAGGVSLSHGATAQYHETAHVPLSDAQPGDLIFYGSPSFVGHDGLYVGGGQMIEAEQSGTLVHYASIYRAGLMPVAARP